MEQNIQQQPSECKVILRTILKKLAVSSVYLGGTSAAQQWQLNHSIGD